MESYERYAGFFPEASLPIMAARDRDPSVGYRARTLASERLNLPAGAWSDAILPDVVDCTPRPRVLAEPPRGALTRFADRLRAALGREIH